MSDNAYPDNWRIPGAPTREPVDVDHDRETWLRELSDAEFDDLLARTRAPKERQ